ncbi:hypothetical protein ACUY3H_08985 [Corynebacterium ureicelerivorans]
MLTFAVGMSAAVNLAARVHLFAWLTVQLERATASREVAFAGLLLLSVASIVGLTGVVAAVAMWFAVGPAGRSGGASSLIPWPALSLAATLSAAATLALQLGGTAALTGTLAGAHPGVVAATGAATANAVNNIPAYLLLEPAAGDAASAMALLVGVNAGSVVTPWASLATLLWADQLRRAAGVPVGGFARSTGVAKRCCD